MAVAVDATGTLVTGTVSPVSSSASITTVAPSAMWIVVQCDDANASISPPTWNGVASTLIGSVNTSDLTALTKLYGLVSPAVGAKALSVSWSGGAPNIQMIALAVTGSVTSSAASCFTGFVSQANNTANSGGTVTVTTGASGDMSVAACNANNASSATLTATSSTSLYSTAGAFVGAASRAPGAASVVWTSSISGLTVTNTIAGCNIAAAAGAALVASWYSPFEEPKRLKASPAGFAELQTNIATRATATNQYPALFDVVALLKKQTGFVDVETNIATVAFPPKVFPALFDPGRLLKVQPTFADLEVPPAVVVLRPPPPAFEPLPSRLLPRPPGFVDNQTNLPTIARPVSPLPGFESSPRLLVRPPGLTELQVPPAAVTVTVTFAPFDGPTKLKQPPDWQQAVPIWASPAVPMTGTFFDIPIPRRRRSSGSSAGGAAGVATAATPSYQFPTFDGPQLRNSAQEWVQNAIAAVATIPVPTFAQFDQPAAKRLTPQEWITLSTYAAFAAPTNLTFLPDQTFDPPARLKRPLEWQVPPPLPPLAPAAVGGDAGGSISGGYFSRKRWHALIGELAQEAHERADQIKRKKERETVAVAIRASLQAAEDADVFGVGAEPMAAIVATLEAATRATKTVEVLAHVKAIHRHIAELKRQIDANDDEEAEAIELLWLL